MINPNNLEEAYQEFSKDLTKWVPDGIIHVDLKLLNDLGLLNNAELEHSVSDAHLNHYFHIIETPDKVTLFNEQFAIWIVPQLVDEIPTTTTLIALLPATKPHLEIAYTTTGVYNTPKYILKVLQHFITEVQDTEAIISSIGKKD
ncbi:MAG: hypothetical protein HYX67_05195 [Candidatus Melainabacteria bacterium]|nr:hypothetical protein [Candidatus Melainabacteria bacterium]